MKKFKTAKQLALSDMKDAGISYSELVDRQIRKTPINKIENPGFKFGLRIAK